MLQIQIGPERQLDPEDDCLGRSSMGSHPGMSEQDAWTAGRGVWKFNADRALTEEEVQIVNTEGTVLAIATVRGISKCGDRYALEGDLLLGDPRVGRPTSTPHPSRNPVAYV